MFVLLLVIICLSCGSKSWFLSNWVAVSSVCVLSGASGVFGVRPAASEETGLPGYLQRWDDFGCQGHRHSGTTLQMIMIDIGVTTHFKRVIVWRNNWVSVCCLCPQCVAESVLHIEEIDTEVVTKWVEMCMWLSCFVLWHHIVILLVLLDHCETQMCLTLKEQSVRGGQNFIIKQSEEISVLTFWS